MKGGDPAYAFGPVPSRRLGRSLGINNIPAKFCTYSCVYCQVGRTTALRKIRSSFYDPECIVGEVRARVQKARDDGEPIDYLTIVPDGDPTLDSRLADIIDRLQPLGVPVAVITNGALTGRDDVRDALSGAAWVSLKVDAVQESVWRRINRPHPSLRLSSIQAGMRAFADAFPGRLTTETMLVNGLNDSDTHLRQVAGFLWELAPHTAYLAIPTRPPAEKWVRAPDESRFNRAYQIFFERLPRVEGLTGYEGDAFASTGDAEADILSVTAVHPMRGDAVRALLGKAGAEWAVVDAMVGRGDLAVTEYQGHWFYLRRFHSTNNGGVQPT